MNKKIFLIITMLMSNFCVFSQTTNATTTPKRSFNIQKIIIPPFLSIDEGSVTFSDDGNNKLINANENSKISFIIRNTGKGDAYGCSVKVEGKGTTAGLNYSNLLLPTIKSGSCFNVVIPIVSSMDTETGDVVFTINVDEPNGFGSEPMELTIGTRKFESPFVEIVSYKLSSNNDAQLRKKKPFTLQVLLQNTDQGIAHNVKCHFAIPDNIFLLEGNNNQSFTTLQPNEKKVLNFELQSNANIKDNINIEFEISESYGKYAKNASIPLHFGQVISSGMTSIRVEGKEQAKIAIQKASLISDVDENIPITRTKNQNTFVLIIANEHYHRVATVPFALNDGNIFREYCIKTFGIGEKHIKYLADATGNDLKAGVNWLSNLTEAFDNPQIIVYYAGHGIPDESSRTAYLLPVDGIISDMSTCYKLDDLYAALGNMPASQIAVFMDACFSGSKREDGMLASARGVALKAKSGVPQGNMVVFSAAQGDETAYPNREQQHGLFTYYLLKKLQESAGDISLKDLGDYITKQVTQQSLLLNDKKQTPCVIPSASVALEWQTWKLK